MKPKFLLSDIQEIVKLNKDFFERSNGCSFLILGASGFVGSWMTQTILYANEKLSLDLKVTAVCRSKKKFFSRVNCEPDSNLHVIESALNSIDGKVFMKDGGFDKILHAATSIATGLDANKDSLLNSIDGTKKILQKLKKIEKKSKVIHLSSGAIYGESARDNVLIDETTKIGDNLDEYSSCKLSIEHLITEASNQGLIEGCNPRLFSFYGPNLPVDKHFAIGNFMRDAMCGNNIKIKSNPFTTRSYLYPTDLISWILAVWENPPNYVTHIGSSQPLTMEALAQSVSKIYGGIPILLENPSQKVSNYVPKTSVIEKNFKVIQRVSLEDGLSRWKKWLESI